MRPLLLLLVLLPTAIGALAWIRAGHDRYEALEREGLALAGVLRGAALEAADTLATAEQNLARRLGAVARRADLEVATTRAPAAEILQRIAEQERVGRIFLFDAAGEPVAQARFPPPIAGTGDEILAPGHKHALQWSDATRALRSHTLEPGATAVEGLRPNVFATRERFGLLYGRQAGGAFLLRANADEIAALRHRFGLEPILERVVDLASVRSVRLVDADGRPRLSAGVDSDGDAGPLPPPGLPPEGAVRTEGPVLRALLPLQTATETLVIDLHLARDQADEAVAASRRTILVGAALALLAALAAGILLLVREAAHRRARAAAQMRLEEERRLAEMGALAGLVTHEISNPLNSIRLALRVWDESPEDDARAALRETMDAEVARMARTLEGYMGLAATDRRVHQRVDATLLERVRRRVDAAAREAQVSVRVDAGGAEGTTVRGDPVVLEQAITNLVRNALEASPAGSTVDVRWSRSESGGVRIAVTDEGEGFPSDAAPLLRLGARRGEGGHGLGLPLAKRFIESHGGRLVLGTAPGGGACVEVHLPAIREEESERA